jgi:hypothetical protein
MLWFHYEYSNIIFMLSISIVFLQYMVKVLKN